MNKTLQAKSAQEMTFNQINTFWEHVIWNYILFLPISTKESHIKH